MEKLYRIMFGYQHRRYSISVNADTPADALELALDRLAKLGEDRDALSRLARSKIRTVRAQIVRIPIED